MNGSTAPAGNSRSLAVPMDIRLPEVDPGKPWDLAWQPLWLASRVSAVATWMGPAEIPASLALTDAMRVQVTRRVEAMEASQQPAAERDVAGEVARLLAFYSNSSQDEVTIKIKLEVWVEVLRHLPIWAIREAIKRWHAGRLTGNTSFMPAPAVISDAASLVLAGCRGQSSTMRRLLEATPVREVSEDERERVGTLFAAFREEFKTLARAMTEDRRSPPIAPEQTDGI